MATRAFRGFLRRGGHRQRGLQAGGGWHRYKWGNLADMSGDDPSFMYRDAGAFKDNATKKLLFKKLSPKQLNN